MRVANPPMEMDPELEFGSHRGPAGAADPGVGTPADPTHYSCGVQTACDSLRQCRHERFPALLANILKSLPTEQKQRIRKLQAFSIVQ